MLPQYLIIVVMRTSSSTVTSIEFVHPPLRLDLAEYTESRLPTNYELISCICHRGRMGVSHFVTMSRLPSFDWALFNDKSGKVVGESQLFDERAYVLLYKRLV